MIKTIAKWLNRSLWFVLVTALIVVAVYVSLGRYYIRYVDDYQDVLLQRFLSYSNLPIAVEQLSGQWSRLSPIFVMEHVSLQAPDTKNTVLTIDKLSLQLDPLRSLLKGSLQVGKLYVNGVQCALLETEPGKWQLKGYPVADGGSTDFDSVVDLVLSVRTVELANAHLQLDFSLDDDAVLDVPELSLHRSGGFRRLRLQANVDKSERPLVAIVEANGDPRQLQQFSARAYLKLEQLDFSAQLPAMRGLGITLQEAVFDSEVWVDWRRGTEITAQGYVSTPYLDLAAISGEPLSPLHDLSLSFRVEKSAANNWQVWVPSFQTRWQGEHLVFEGMELDVEQDAAHFSIPQLSVDQAVKHLLAVNLLAEPEQRLIETLKPQGTLRNIHASLSRPPLDASSDELSKPQFSLRANLQDVSIEPWQGAPGASGVSGYLEARPLSGMVELDARNMQLYFPHVYHHKLSFPSALGQVKWQLDTERVSVNSGPLALQAEFGPANAILSLDLPLHQGEGTPTMDLAIGIRDADAAARHLLIPYTLNPDFLHWMDSSVPEGHVTEGGFIYRGSLLHHDSLNRTVQLFLQVDQTTLDFHADWPPLTDISGLVMIDDGAVEVTPQVANMSGLEIASALVTVDPIEDGMWLKVDAEASGPAAGALNIVNYGLINRLVDGAFQGWELEGQVSTHVDLGVPLGGSQKTSEINVAVDLVQSHLAIPSLRLKLDELQGPLYYHSEKGISSPGLSAQLYGRPLKATVSQQKNGSVLVDMAGTASMADVAAWSKQPALAFVSGESHFDAEIRVAAKDPTASSKSNRSEFILRSDLSGVQIDLPAPYGKNAQQVLPLEIHYPLAGESRQLQIQLQKSAELQLQFEHSEPVSALLVLGNSENLQHYPGLFLVTGQVSTFNLEQWRPVVDRYLEESKRYAAESSATTKPLLLAASQLQIEQFDGFSQHAEQLTLDMRQREDSWWLSILSPMFDGELLLPDNTSLPISIRLDRLKLPDQALSFEQTNQGLLSTINLAELSAFSAYVAIADLQIGTQHYGSLSFELQTEPSKLKLKNLGGYIRGVRIGIEKPANFEWTETEEGESCRLYGNFDFANIGNVLRQWQYEKFIESSYGMGSADLRWPGRPDQWQLQISQGPLYIRLKKGRFLSVSDTAEGAMKVVGVVNLTNVMRRLRLDFSDLTDKGISFDEVEGEAILEDQKLVIVDDLVIKSPSSRFLLRGDANLQAKQLDMELVTTLPVASNLPWIAALAGGLPTAAGVYVASKIFENQVEKFSSAVYAVKGDWNAPEMKFKQVFDNSNPSTSTGSSSQKSTKGK